MSRPARQTRVRRSDWTEGVTKSPQTTRPRGSAPRRLRAAAENVLDRLGGRTRRGSSPPAQTTVGSSLPGTSAMAPAAASTTVSSAPHSTSAAPRAPGPRPARRAERALLGSPSGARASRSTNASMMSSQRPSRPASRSSLSCVVSRSTSRPGGAPLAARTRPSLVSWGSIVSRTRSADPKLSRSPGRSGPPLTRRPLIRVPFLLPRSSTRTVSPSTLSTAWRRDTPRRGSTTRQDEALPTRLSPGSRLNVRSSPSTSPRRRRLATSETVAPHAVVLSDPSSVSRGL